MRKLPDTISDFVTVLAVLVIAGSVVFSFYTYYVQKDYALYIKASCDPATEECLSEECDEEDPRCINTTDGIIYYKEVYEESSQTK
jgi:hypothetical protein